jgi:hypothetical protein
MIRPFVNVADATCPEVSDISECDFDRRAEKSANLQEEKSSSSEYQSIKGEFNTSNSSITAPTLSDRPTGRPDTPRPPAYAFDWPEEEESISGDEVDDWMNCTCSFCSFHYILPSSSSSPSSYESSDQDTTREDVVLDATSDQDTTREDVVLDAIKELSNELWSNPTPKSLMSEADELYCMSSPDARKYQHLVRVFGPKEGRKLYRAWRDTRARLQSGTEQPSLFERMIAKIPGFHPKQDIDNYFVGVPMNEDLMYTYKLVEDLLFFMFMLYSNRTLKGWILSIATFAKFRSDKPLFLDKMVPALKDFCEQLFDGFTPEQEPQGLPETLDTIEGMLGNFTKLQGSPIYEKMHRMCMYAISFSLFEKAGIKWDVKKYIPMEKHVLKQNYHFGASFITNLIDTIVCIIRTGYLVWTEGNADAIFHSGSDYEKWFNEVMWLQNAAKHIGNPAPHGYTAKEFLERLTTARNHGQMILKGAINTKAPGLKQIRSFVYSVESMYFDEIARINTQAHRDVPFSILINGATNVGKSTFAKILRSYFQKKRNLPAGDEYVFTRAPNSEYWDGYKSHQWCLQLDDIAYKNPSKAMEDQTVEEVLQIINSIPFMPNQAHLENKGMTPLLVEFVIATTNKKNLNAYHYFSEPSAVQRRFPFVITITVLPEFCEKGFGRTHMMCSKLSKAETTKEKGIADCWLITVEKVMPAAISGKQAEYVVIKKDIRMPEFIRWYRDAINEHIDKIETMNISNSCIDNMSLCPVCEMPTCECLECGYSTCMVKPEHWDDGLEDIFEPMDKLDLEDVFWHPEPEIPKAPALPEEEEHKEMKIEEEDEKYPTISLRPYNLVDLPTSESSSKREKICLPCISGGCTNNPCGDCQTPGCKCFSLRNAEPQAGFNITSDWTYLAPLLEQERPPLPEMPFWRAFFIQLMFGFMVGWFFMAQAFPYIERFERWYDGWRGRRRVPVNRQNVQSVPMDDISSEPDDDGPVENRPFTIPPIIPSEVEESDERSGTESDQSEQSDSDVLYDPINIRPTFLDVDHYEWSPEVSDVDSDDSSVPPRPVLRRQDCNQRYDQQVHDAIVTMYPICDLDATLGDEYVRDRRQYIIYYLETQGVNLTDDEALTVSVQIARLEAMTFAQDLENITHDIGTSLFGWLHGSSEEGQAFAQTVLAFFGLINPALQSEPESDQQSWSWSFLIASGVALGACAKASKWTYTKCKGKYQTMRDKIDDYFFDATTAMFWRHLGDRVQRKSNYPKMFATLLAGSATLYAAYKTYSYFTKLPATLQSVSTGEPPVPHEKETENVWYRENYPLSTFDMTERSKSCAGKNYNTVLHILEKNLVNVTFKSGDGKTLRCRCLGVGGQNYLFNNHCLPRNPELRATLITQHTNQGVSENKLVSIFQSQIYRDPKNDLALVIIPNMPPRKNIIELFAKPTLKVRSDGVYVDKDSDGKTSWRPVQCLARTTQYCTKLVTTLNLWSGVMNENPTDNGDCGMPLVFKLPGGTVIAGIHSLGLSTTVSATLVTVDWLKDAITKLPELTLQSGVPHFSSGKHKVEIGSLHHKSCLRWINHGEAHVYGSLKSGIRHPKSMVRDTPMFHELKKAGYTKKFTDPDLKSWKPWRLAALDSTNTPNNLNYDILMECAKAFFEDIVAKVPEEQFKEMKPYDMFTAVNGAPGVKYVDGINRQSSAGSPWNCTKEKLLHKVPPRGEYQDPVMPVQEVLDLAAHYEAEYAAGRRVYPLYTAHLKDEPVKFKKKKIGKTRVFTGSSLAHSLVVRRFILPFIRLMHNNRYAFEAAPGTACQSSEWGDMYKYLTHFGEDRVVAGDFRGFDKGMAALLVLLAFLIIIWCCERSGNYTEADIRILRGIATDTAFPVVNFNGDLIMLHGTNPSGNNATVEINCLVNSLYMRMCFRLSNPAKEVKTFKIYVHLMTYGDDNIMNVSGDIDWFNHTVIADQLAKVGIEYTMPDKTSESVPFIDMKDATFLKRTWVWNEEVKNYFCPLEEESIEKSLMTWTASKTICPQEQCIAVVSAAVCEYFWYGKQVFQEKTKLLRDTIHNIDMDNWVQESTFPTWDELIARWYKQSGIVKPE